MISSSPFQNALAEFVYYRTYSRYRYDLGRREHWPETVERTINYFREIGGDKLTDAEYDELKSAFEKLEVVPSMRLVTMAGEAARRQNLCTYNCSALNISSIEAFAETLYILSQGTGVGFSVERSVIEQLPTAKRPYRHLFPTPMPIVVEDTAEGWADAFKHTLEYAYEGIPTKLDITNVRPAGAILVTKGGRSSGGEVLVDLCDFAQKIVLNAGEQERKLTSLEVHDIVTKVGTVIVAGSVRRSALISLSELDDVLMREAKVGPFWEKTPWRAMANNSAVYNEKPTWKLFKEEWDSLVASGTGERGIMNRYAVRKNRPTRRKDHVFLTNPCNEISLRDQETCNLSEAIIRSDDTAESMRKKVRVAAIFGTLQSTLTHFPYVREGWKKNAEEERLLGVSMTGQMDNVLLRNSPQLMRELRDIAVATNKEFAHRLGINQSVSVSACKPSGSVSVIANSSSGVHVRWSPYYIRRVRITAYDPLCKLMKIVNAPMFPETGQSAENANTWVIEFPVKSPEGSVYRKDVSAIEQAKYVLMVQKNYAEHSVSATIYVGADEWDELGKFVYENFDFMAGLSFLPRDDAIYPLAPYEEITENEYLRRQSEFPQIPYELLWTLEAEDFTEGSQTLACVAGACDVL